ncbi:MAG TPA: type II secretion system protein [Verrucomicrobiae bacterium]|nr:type II secretion system protein [Verrucomicrobiae bacterium]
MNLAGNSARSRRAAPWPGRPSARAISSTAAFSLLELLIVAALVIIMFTLYWGGGNRGYQTRQIAACEKNLEYVFVALKTYSVDNDGKFPFLAAAQTSEPVLSQLVPRSTTRTEFFICPGSHDKDLPPSQPFANRTISYAYYMGRTPAEGADQPLISDRQVDTNSKLSGQLIFSLDGKKPGNNHNKFGGNVMFCDGSVRSTPAHAAFDLTNAPNVVLLNPNP